MKLNNLDIRERIEQKRLKYYEVAHECGITPVTLSVWLQTELTPDRRARIESAIENIKL